MLNSWPSKGTPVPCPVVSYHCPLVRQKSGIWGFRSDRNDEVNGWQAKVFSATGVEVITRTRTEHLPEGDKKKQKRKLY